MFSADKNIETFSQLVEALKGYALAEKEHLRFSVAEKLVRLLKAIVLFSIGLIMFFVTIIFAGITLAMLLSTMMHPAFAYLIVTLMLVVLFFVFKACSKTIIEKPLVRFISSILLNDK